VPSFFNAPEWGQEGAKSAWLAQTPIDLPHEFRQSILGSKKRFDEKLLFPFQSFPLSTVAVPWPGQILLHGADSIELVRHHINPFEQNDDGPFHLVKYRLGHVFSLLLWLG